MPEPIKITIIQTEPEWLHSGNGAAMDAMLLPESEWWEVWGMGPEPETKRDLDRFWDRLQDESDWRLCQRCGVGL